VYSSSHGRSPLPVKRKHGDGSGCGVNATRRIKNVWF